MKRKIKPSQPLQKKTPSGYATAKATMGLLWKMAFDLLRSEKPTTLSMRKINSLALTVNKIMTSYCKIKTIELKMKENSILEAKNNLNAKNKRPTEDAESKGIPEGTLHQIEEALNLF